MANPKLTDGHPSTELKHQKYIEEVPDVDKCFLSRCYNSSDSLVYRSRGKRAAERSRQTMVTYLMALRKLARRLCLDPSENQSPQKIAEITRTRACLGPGFFELMGFYGVDIVPSAGLWTFTESASAQALATALDNFID